MDIPQRLVLLGRYAQNRMAPSGPRWPLALTVSSCVTVEDKSMSQKHPAGISIGWWSLCPQLQQSLRAPLQAPAPEKCDQRGPDPHRC